MIQKVLLRHPVTEHIIYIILLNYVNNSNTGSIFGTPYNYNYSYLIFGLLRYMSIIPKHFLGYPVTLTVHIWACQYLYFDAFQWYIFRLGLVAC